MNTKENLLFVFESQKGEFISGETIAEKLNISRSAVWKAINALKEDGYEIESAGRRGYRMAESSDRLSSASIMQNLENHVFNVGVALETGSTNDDAKALAEKGAPEYTVVAAESQNKGKGRLGRSFYSPERTGIYFSIILRPHMPVSDATYITTAAAAAAAEAIEEICGKPAGIKWVNDIFMDGKKVCGILTEASFDMESGSLSYAVLGIGINVVPPSEGFPEDLSNIAGCLYPNGDYVPGVRSRLLAKVLDNFYKYYRRFPEKAFLEEYRRRSILTGAEVNVLRGSEKYPASVIGIDDSCRLIVKADGKEIALDSGEVSVRLK